MTEKIALPVVLDTSVIAKGLVENMQTQLWVLASALRLYSAVYYDSNSS